MQYLIHDAANNRIVDRRSTLEAAIARAKELKCQWAWHNQIVTYHIYYNPSGELAHAV